MTKNKKKKYCYLTPNYPKEAFIVGVLYTSKTLPIMMMTLSTVSKNIDDVVESINEFAKGLKKAKTISPEENLELVYAAVLFSITFQKLFPLKKEYWLKKSEDYNLKEKLLAFLPVIDNPYFYKLLVTPFGHLKKDWEFCAAYPFSMFSEDAEIEKFMYESDQQVDIEAKYAAIYSFGIPKRFNWKTGDISDIEKNIPKKPEVVN